MNMFIHNLYIKKMDSQISTSDIMINEIGIHVGEIIKGNTLKWYRFLCKTRYIQLLFFVSRIEC